MFTVTVLGICTVALPLKDYLIEEEQAFSGLIQKRTLGVHLLPPKSCASGCYFLWLHVLLLYVRAV